MTLAARTRRCYWKHVRRYRYETCGRPNHPHGTITRGCGRPVGVVWRAPTGMWNYVVTGRKHTIYTLRGAPMAAPWKERAEGVGGVLCLACFDREARERGVILRWESRPL